jgi:Flp pilus assembly protein TadG
MKMGTTFAKATVHRSARGQSLVELALTLPLLILILIGLLDLGRMLIAYVTIQNAAREGAHYGISNPDDTAGHQTAG